MSKPLSRKPEPEDMIVNICTHDHTTDGEHRGFVVPVAVHPYTDENRAAHGGITYVETCDRCGARRKVNRNWWHVEVGTWGPDRDTRERREREELARREHAAEAEEDAILFGMGITVIDANDASVTVRHSDGRRQTVRIGDVEEAARDPWHPRLTPEEAARQETPEERISRLAYRAVLRQAGEVALSSDR